MSKFNDLYLGDFDDVLYWLENNTLDNNELTAALCNAFKKIARMRAEIDKLKAVKG